MKIIITESQLGHIMEGGEYAYHVTRRGNVKSIMSKGLIPRVPKDIIGGDVKGVYLFPSIDDVENALYNWLGERIEEWEEENDKEYDEVVLKVDISGLEGDIIRDLDWEIICLVRIGPERIVDVFEM